ncbi:MAG TPA: hypothetical protein VMZ52_11950 [Bryobacteraceae bacterium]|nr:hypothetical protein [Bryobacteraceae bacterium]
MARKSSSDRQDFVADQANALGLGWIEEKSGRRFEGVFPQRLPGVPLREDVLCEAFGAKAIFQSPE